MTRAERPEPEPQHELVDRARAFIAEKAWTFADAVDLVDHPHSHLAWYDQATQVDRKSYLVIRELIIAWGWDRRWGGRTWRTFTLDGYHYWHVWPVINRVALT